MREFAVGKARIELAQGDLTKVQVDAIVNAANENLYHSGGLAYAISRAGGLVVDAESRRVAPCPTGSAVVTSGGRLPARYVIHAVGPIWKGGSSGEPELLASAYRASLERATELGIKTIAFPSISTGIYGYPIERAAPVALASICEYLESRPDSALERALFVLFREADLLAYETALTRLAEAGGS